MIQRTILHERSPYAPKFEDRSREDTEMQERCARGHAWRMAKSILKLKEKDKANFFSPIEVWCLLAPSLTNPEGREFAVDSEASIHMLSKKDLNSADWRQCKFVTANGEVQTN